MMAPQFYDEFATRKRKKGKGKKRGGGGERKYNKSH
jgi:hypothetical protein